MPVAARAPAKRCASRRLVLLGLVGASTLCSGGAPAFLAHRPWRRGDSGEAPPRQVGHFPPPPPTSLTASAPAASSQQYSAPYFAAIALAGAISCSVTHSFVVPLDVIKTALQTDASLSGPRAAITQLTRGCSGGRCFTPFMAGLGATSVGYFIQGATKFGGYEVCKRLAYEQLQQMGELGETIARDFRLPVMIASAACAETLASALLCPLEVLKLRMQTSPELAALGLRRAMLETAQRDGVGALFKGFVPIAMRQVPYTACKLVTFEIGIAMLTRAVDAHRERIQRQTGRPAFEPPRTAVVLAAGLMAGAAAAVVSQPFDLLLTRLCGSTSVTMLTECVIADSVPQQLLYLINLGPAAFTGLGPRLVMISLMTSCQFFLYDNMRTVLNCRPLA